MKKIASWSWPYRKSYYITHPWKWVRQFGRGFKVFYWRARYGFAPCDVWEFCDWYPRVGAAALEYLADNTCSHPCGETESGWRETLQYLSKRLTRCANSLDICFGEDRNEYKEQFHFIMGQKRQVSENGIMRLELSPEEEEVRDKYYAREKEIKEADQQYIVDTFRMIGEELSKLWD